MQEHYGVEMVAPHRSNRTHPTQDGRPLRRYRRRWMIERLFAWLQVFRRLVTRYEKGRRWRVYLWNSFAQLSYFLG